MASIMWKVRKGSSLGRLPVVLNPAYRYHHCSMYRDSHSTVQVLLLAHNESTQISTFIFQETWIDHIQQSQISIFCCSFSWLTYSYKVLFFSFCRLLVYDQNQWGLKLSTAIYKMQLLYTTLSKTPVVYMLRHNLCYLPPERYRSFSVNVLQEGLLSASERKYVAIGADL